MKKYKIIIVFLSMFLLVNVKAFTKGTPMNLSIKSTSKSTSMYWFWAATDNSYCKNDIKSSSSGSSICTTDDKGSYIKRENGINLDIYSAKEQGSGKTHEAYCINAHLNDSKNGVVKVETVIGTPDDPQKKLHAGYAAIFDKYNNGSGGYSKAQFISALRVYTMKHSTYSRGPLESAVDGKVVTRKQMYNHYNNLTKEIYSNELSYGSVKENHFYFKSCSSNTCTSTVKKKIKELIDAAESAYNNYKDSSSKQEVVFTEEKAEGNIITYKISLKNFTKNVSKIKFLSVTSGTYNSVKICSDAACSNDIGLNKDYVAKNNNDTLYLKIELNDQGKDAVCDGKLDIKYSFDGAGGYTGAILSNGEDTYQRYIFIEKSSGNEETQTLPKSTKISCDSPVDNCDIQYPNKSSLENSCCKNPSMSQCECLGKTGMKKFCCEYPSSILCSPVTTDCDTEYDPVNETRLNTCCHSYTVGTHDWACCIGEYCPPKKTYGCSNLPPGSIERYCCEDPLKCKGCDSTKEKCNPTCNEDIDPDKLKNDCKNSASRLDITYEEGKDGLFNCIINNKSTNKNKINTVYINDYSSMYCKESYTFNVPGSFYLGSGRNMNLDLTLKNANLDCYITTSRKKYTAEYYKQNIDLMNAEAIYNAYYGVGERGCSRLLLEHSSQYASCISAYQNELNRYINDIQSLSNEIKNSYDRYIKSVEIPEYQLKNHILGYHWEIEPHIKYYYDEPQGSSDKYIKSLYQIDLYDEKDKGISPSTKQTTKGYCTPLDYTADQPFSDADECTNAFAPIATERKLYQCSIYGDSVYCDFETKETREPYYRLKRELDEKIDYETKRWYYISVPKGDIKTSETKPIGNDYSLINGVPIAFTTPEGTYNYYIQMEQLGFDNHLSDKVTKIGLDKEKYVCTYTVDETIAEDEPKYCVKTTSEYICDNEVYFKIKQSGELTADQLESLVSTYVSAGKCKSSSSYSSSDLCAPNIYDYNCQNNNIGRRCSSTVYSDPPSPPYTPDPNRSKIYDVDYRTITTNNINPTDRTLGYNWNVKSSNSLIARKALDTRNYILYHSKAEYEKANGSSSSLRPLLKQYGETNTTFTITLDAYSIDLLRKFDITDDTLECYDYIDDTISNRTGCERKNFTWNSTDNSCRAENVFCYSKVITELIKDSKIETNAGTRPTSRGDIKASSFDDYTSLSDELSQDIPSLSYIPIKESESTAISSDYYQIKNSNTFAQNYWTIYDFVTLDVDNDNNADVGPSWR